MGSPDVELLEGVEISSQQKESPVSNNGEILKTAQKIIGVVENEIEKEESVSSLRDANTFFKKKLEAATLPEELRKQGYEFAEDSSVQNIKDVNLEKGDLVFFTGNNTLLMVNIGQDYLDENSNPQNIITYSEHHLNGEHLRTITGIKSYKDPSPCGDIGARIRCLRELKKPELTKDNFLLFIQNKSEYLESILYSRLKHVFKLDGYIKDNKQQQFTMIEKFLFDSVEKYFGIGFSDIKKEVGSYLEDEDFADKYFELIKDILLNNQFDTEQKNNAIKLALLGNSKKEIIKQMGFLHLYKLDSLKIGNINFLTPEVIKLFEEKLGWSPEEIQIELLECIDFQSFIKKMNAEFIKKKAVEKEQQSKEKKEKEEARRRQIYQMVEMCLEENSGLEVIQKKLENVSRTYLQEIRKVVMALFCNEARNEDYLRLIKKCRSIIIENRGNLETLSYKQHAEDIASSGDIKMAPKSIERVFTVMGFIDKYFRRKI